MLPFKASCLQAGRGGFGRSLKEKEIFTSSLNRLRLGFNSEVGNRLETAV